MELFEEFFLRKYFVFPLGTVEITSVVAAWDRTMEQGQSIQYNE